ncbi:MAG TPA: penicillin acylase family protein [Hyphomicrobiaceae bacterium]
MKRILKWLGIGLAGLAGLAAVAAGVGYAALRNTVPAASGTLALPGLSAPVEIVRDREGVPHIFAKTTDDLYMAMGFVHAQDRLWQMELQRRTGQGRLSEIFGERTFGADVFLRTLDLYGHAERSLAGLPAAATKALEAYARGVNAYITRPLGLLEPRLPPEFLLLRHKPEPWQPADSTVIVKLMALSLSMNINQEILRLSLAAQGLTSAEIGDLMPLDAADSPPRLPEIAELYPLNHPQKRAAVPARRPDAAGVHNRPIGELAGDPLAGLGDLAGTGASNNWVVSGVRTRSGKPLLANDPHLHLEAPSVWYLAHLALERPGAEVANAVGASLPGVPLIVLGRGDRLAWGFTNTGADVEDIFVEKVNPKNPREYLAPEGWLPFSVDEMRIAVKGAGVRTVERRRTRHGPVLPGFYRNLDRLLAANHVAALKWTALTDDDTTVAAGLFDPDMTSVADYMNRMRLFVVPMQSMVVADSAGHIGLIAPGRVPVRSPANKVAGRAPVPGWDDTYDWKGYLKFDELPREDNPNIGAIGTANARIVDRDYPHLLTYDWEAPFRQQRIKQLVFDADKHDLASMRAAQTDVLSLAVARLQPLMIAAAQAERSVDPAVLDQLTLWDARMQADRAEPLIFTAWLREAVRAIYRDDLGDAFGRYFDSRALALIRLLEGHATARDWCDDRTTPEHETCGAVLAAALNRALASLQGRFGPDRSKWRWGDAHVALSEHRPFGLVGMLAPFFNVEVPSGGDNYTLNRGRPEFAEEPPFANKHAASFRAIYDLADLDRSLYIQTTGQSGNAFSQFYRSFARRWAEGDYIEIPTRRDAIAQARLGTWTLTPR